MRGVFARGAASFTHALAPLDDAELSAALRNLVRDDDDCEAAALDALADVWAASAQHVALLADALVRRGVVRCRAVAAWVLDPRNESPWAGSTIGASFKPHELLQVAVDRSLDLLSAAVASAAARGADAATDGVVRAQLDEAREVALEICSRLARGLCDRDGDDSADAVSYRDAALGTLYDLRATYENARWRASGSRSAPLHRFRNSILDVALQSSRQTGQREPKRVDNGAFSGCASRRARAASCVAAMRARASSARDRGAGP
ncbi:hypothetical protein JL721_2922 [Aureococcus anophagefferens]|nr:hypothetical protein JL721_2922 [Aureococcus anophagefferens]